jgi:hypothetical protein
MQTMYNQSKFNSNLLPSTGNLGTDSAALNINYLSAGSASKNDIQNQQSQGVLPHRIYTNGNGVFGTSQHFIPAISSMPIIL